MTHMVDILQRYLEVHQVRVSDVSPVATTAKVLMPMGCQSLTPRVENE